MPCKKAELISAINSFGAAKASGDNTLQAFSVNLVQSLLDTLDFEKDRESTTNKIENKLN